MASTTRLRFHQHNYWPSAHTMHTFFHGWRRKAGLGTLGLACAVAGMWMRSYGDGDVFRMNGLGRSVLLDSTNGRVDGYAWRGSSSIPYPLWSSRSHRPYTVTVAANTALPDVADVNLQLAMMVIPEQVWKLTIHHWCLTLPLTLLSAYLLLWKPRKRA